MFDFGKQIAAPLQGLLSGVRSIIDTVHTSDPERMAAQAKLLKVEAEFQAKFLEAQAALVQHQATVVTAEVGSKNWLAANWRPLMMLLFTYIIAHNYVLAPLLQVPSVEIPPKMWDLIEVGVGGYIVGRSVEKVAPSIAGALKK